MDVEERILAISAELFSRSGIRAVTMDEISKEAGVSKRTVYEIFKDKDELLRACLIYIDEVKGKEQDELIAGSENTIDMLFIVLKNGIELINTVNPLFITDLKRYHYKVWKETYRHSDEKRISRTHLMLQKGIQEGLFREDTHIKIVTILLHEHLKMMSDEQVFPPTQYSLKTIFRNVLINFMRGIATRKGLELIDCYDENS